MWPDRFERKAMARAASSAPWGPRGGAAGFVLLETLVAVALAALLLTVLSRSLLTTWSGTARAREDLQALMIAHTVLEGMLPGRELSAGIRTGTSGGYAWRAETLPSSTRAAVADSNVPADRQIDVAPAAGRRWQLYHILVTVAGPSGRKVVLDAFRLGA